MIESNKAKLRNHLVSAHSELRFGNVGKAKKHLKGALMILDDSLETQFCNGVNICPPDGEYKIYVDNLHILIKSIKGDQGQNHLPLLTKIPLLPWCRLAQKYHLPTGDFTVRSSDNEKCCLLEYKDGRIIDKITQIRGDKNTWAGGFFYEGELKFWFRMVKIDE